jgi:hypothetical protein
MSSQVLHRTIKALARHKHRPLADTKQAIDDIRKELAKGLVNDVVPDSDDSAGGSKADSSQKSDMTNNKAPQLENTMESRRAIPKPVESHPDLLLENPLASYAESFIV